MRTKEEILKVIEQLEELWEDNPLNFNTKAKHLTRMVRAGLNEKESFLKNPEQSYEDHFLIKDLKSLFLIEKEVRTLNKKSLMEYLLHRAMSDLRTDNFDRIFNQINDSTKFEVKALPDILMPFGPDNTEKFVINFEKKWGVMKSKCIKLFETLPNADDPYKTLEEINNILLEKDILEQINPEKESMWIRFKELFLEIFNNYGIDQKLEELRDIFFKTELLGINLPIDINFPKKQLKRILQIHIEWWWYTLLTEKIKTMLFGLDLE